MTVTEIKARDLNPEQFIGEKVKEIQEKVGDGIVINALSGGVDSSVVTMLGHRALGDRLKTYFIDNGLMRQGEPAQVVSLFSKLGVPVVLVGSRREFFEALRDISDPEKKRKAITQTFYKELFSPLAAKVNAEHLLQGTILTDIEETVAGVKWQHNVLTQAGIDTFEKFGYKVIEPLRQLRKDGVRIVAAALDLPEEVYNRMPFPGPALATRVVGRVTRNNISIVRKATAIVEEELMPFNPFQCLAVLHPGKVAGMVNGRRKLGYHIEVRCWESVDARTGVPTDLPRETERRLVNRIISEIPEVVSVAFNATPKPPCTIEAV